MDHLPNELILMILNKLDSLDDLFECRLVCQRWNKLVKLIRIQTLQVGERGRCEAVDDFSIDLNPILFETNGIDFIKSNLMKMTILSRLKQVFFCDIKFTTEFAWISFEKSIQQLR